MECKRCSNQVYRNYEYCKNHIFVIQTEYCYECGIYVSKKNLCKIFSCDYLKNPNLCIKCGIDIGAINPRQYCGKTYCLNN